MTFFTKVSGRHDLPWFVATDGEGWRTEDAEGGKRSYLLPVHADETGCAGSTRPSRGISRNYVLMQLSALNGRQDYTVWHVTRLRPRRPASVTIANGAQRLAVMT